MLKHFSCLYFLLLITLFGNAQNTYLNISNDFGYLYSEYDNSLKIENRDLVHHNLSSEPKFQFINENFDACKYYIELKFAHLSNSENKSYAYYEGKKKRKISHPSFGITWNYVDSLNYNSMKIEYLNSNIHDFTDNRFMRITISNTKNGETMVLNKSDIDKFVNLYSGYNIISITQEEKYFAIKMGDRYLHQIYSDDNHKSSHKIGYWVGKGAKIAIQYLVINKTPIDTNQNMTDWTSEKIAEYLSTSTDPYEGYWEYFDKVLDYDRLRLGGRYKLAIIKNGDSYDLIYVSGAVVWSDKWVCGMVKGTLSPTRFVDHYDLTWYDSTLKEISKDVYAKIVENVILEIHIPQYKSNIRFVKME